MMSQKRIFGLSTVATLLLGAGVALYAEPDQRSGPATVRGCSGPDRRRLDAAGRCILAQRDSRFPKEQYRFDDMWRRT